MLRALFRNFHITQPKKIQVTPSVLGAERKAKLQAARAEQAETMANLPKLKIRKGPYFRKGTKSEYRPLRYIKRHRFNKIPSLRKPDSILVTCRGNDDYVAGKYKRKVGTIGSTMRQYQTFNWQNNDPGFISRTEILPTPPSLPGHVKPADPVSVALAYKRLKSISELECLTPGRGAGYRFTESPHNRRRRIGHMEAKRLLMDEIERKRVSFLLNDDVHGRHYPTRAEMPKIFSIVEEAKKLLEDVPVEKGRRPSKKKLVGVRPQDKAALAMQKEKELKEKSRLEEREKLRKAYGFSEEKKQQKLKDDEIDDLFNL